MIRYNNNVINTNIIIYNQILDSDWNKQEIDGFTMMLVLLYIFLSEIFQLE